MIYPKYILINFKNQALYQFRLSEAPKLSTIQRTKSGGFIGYCQEKWAENIVWILETAPYSHSLPEHTPKKIQKAAM